MSFSIKTTTDPKDPAGFIAEAVLRQLEAGKRVLLFLTGGSGVAVGVEVAEILKSVKTELLKNLTVTLTDERYGVPGHKDSNWQQLVEKGFNLEGAKLAPVLTGESLEATVKNFNNILTQEFQEAQYKIGLFGIGKDGHTAGILPESSALSSNDMVSSFNTPLFSRITMTPKAIKMMDEVVVFMQGEDKWPVLENLKENCDIMHMPAQILKQVPLLTIFTDKK